MILHIGMPRTGTTALQRKLYSGVSGYCYPAPVSAVHKPSHGWISRLMYTGHLSELERRINSYGRGNLVFSDEGICTVWHLFSLDAKLCLSRLVNERQGTVVVTWRDKQETAWSLWTGLREYTLPYLPGLDLSSEATWLTCDFLKAFMDFDLKRREFDFYFNKIKHLDYERDNMITKFHQQVLYGTCLTSN